MSRPPAEDFDPRLLSAALDAFPHEGGDVPGLRAYRATFDLPTVDGVVHRVGVVDVDGRDIFVQRFEPPHARGHVLLLHGLFDHGGLWRHQIRWALERSLTAVTVDLPGHGLSSGERAHIDDFEHYVDALEAALPVVADGLPRPFVAIGQSTGCSVLMQALLDPARSFLAPDDLVLVAPLVRPVSDRLMRLALPVLGPFVRALPRTSYGNTTDPAYNAFRQAGDPLQIRELPVSWLRSMARWSRAFDALGSSDLSPLVIQGTADRVVDWRRNLPRIEAHFASPRIEHFDGALHNLKNETAEIRARIEALLDERLRALGVEVGEVAQSGK